VVPNSGKQTVGQGACRFERPGIALSVQSIAFIGIAGGWSEAAKRGYETGLKKADLVGRRQSR